MRLLMAMTLTIRLLPIDENRITKIYANVFTALVPSLSELRHSDDEVLRGPPPPCVVLSKTDELVRFWARVLSTVEQLVAF